MIKRWATPHNFYEGVNGQYIDFDKAYGVQCVDLFDYFCSQMQVPFQWVDGAKDFWNKFAMAANFEKIAVKDLKDGDWVVFNEKLGYGYGHIAMFRKFTSGTSKAIFLGQNQLVGNAVACQIELSTANAYGGLRLKGWLDYSSKPSKPSKPKVDNVLNAGEKFIFPKNYKAERVTKINGVWAVYNSELGAYINVKLVTETNSKGVPTADQNLSGDISGSYFKIPGTFVVGSSGSGTFKNGYVIPKSWGFKINAATLQEVA
ncbi:CHAP domain-containing protein [Breznakia sp. OttesenSCG-928-G09]|nr:CHAP domain-containing protein [Breznakia sp. OttesenSCG-928-G09]